MIRNNLTEKLYSHIGRDPFHISEDYFRDYLTEEYAKGNHFWWFMDETTSAAINKHTGEIINDPIF